MTLDIEFPNSEYAICEICFWENDLSQFDDPDYDGGANKVSLKQAQKNYIEFGVSEKEFLEYVRKPNENDFKDPNWKTLGE